MARAAGIEEVFMGRSPYQSEKRRKELARLKKQEEKRQRRFNKKNEGEGVEGQTEAVPGSEESTADTPTTEPVQDQTQNDAQP